MRFRFFKDVPNHATGMKNRLHRLNPFIDTAFSRLLHKVI